MIFSENPAPSGIRNRTAGSDIIRLLIKQLRKLDAHLKYALNQNLTGVPD